MGLVTEWGLIKGCDFDPVMSMSMIHQVKRFFTGGPIIIWATIHMKLQYNWTQLLVFLETSRIIFSISAPDELN